MTNKNYNSAVSKALDELASELPEDGVDVLDFNDHVVNIWKDCKGNIKLSIHAGGSRVTILTM